MSQPFSTPLSFSASSLADKYIKKKNKVNNKYNFDNNQLKVNFIYKPQGELTLGITYITHKERFDKELSLKLRRESKIINRDKSFEHSRKKE